MSMATDILPAFLEPPIDCKSVTPPVEHENNTNIFFRAVHCSRRLSELNRSNPAFSLSSCEAGRLLYNVF